MCVSLKNIHFLQSATGSRNVNSTGTDKSGSNVPIKKSKLSDNIGGRTAAESCTVGSIAAQSNNEVDWHKCLQWANENAKQFDAMTTDDWNNLAVDTGVKYCKTNSSNGKRKIVFSKNVCAMF